MKPVRLPRGSTFAMSCQYLEDGQPAVLPSNVRVQIRRDPDELIAEAVVSIIDSTSGKFKAIVKDTSEWPLGRLRASILYTYSDGSDHETPRIYFEIGRSTTHA